MEKKYNSWVKWVVNGYWLFQLLRSGTMSRKRTHKIDKF